MDTGIVTTIAGNSANPFFQPGDIGDGGPATQAELDSPTALALDGDGNLYIADSGNSRVRKISMGTGIIFTVAGTGVAGYTGDNVPATTSELNQPGGIGVDLAGNLYISDSGNNLIREVNQSSGIITTIAGLVGASGGYNGDDISNPKNKRYGDHFDACRKRDGRSGWRRQPCLCCGDAFAGWACTRS
jgi:hypothetical protein